VEYLFEAHGLVDDLHVKHLLEQPRPNSISSTLNSRFYLAKYPRFTSYFPVHVWNVHEINGLTYGNVPFI
jgi:hypothetical protein